LLDHQVIFFHDQHLTPEQHLVLRPPVGELQIHDFVEPAEEDQHILEVRKEPYETRISARLAHRCPVISNGRRSARCFNAHEISAVGGDTMFASQYLAYEALSDGMKAMLGGLTAIHSAGRIYGVNPARSLAGLPSSMTIRYTEERKRRNRAPGGAYHVETGRKCLYVNGNFTVRFKDMTERSSAPLLNWLYQHAVRPESPVASRNDAAARNSRIGVSGHQLCPAHADRIACAHPEATGEFRPATACLIEPVQQRRALLLVMS